MTERIVIYTISYRKFFCLAWGPTIFFISIGVYNKGFAFFDTDKWESTRFFGENKYILLLFMVLYLGYFIKETISSIMAKGVYIFSDGNSLFCRDKHIALISEIDVEKSHFTVRYFFWKFMHLWFKNGKHKKVSLGYAILVNKQYISQHINSAI